MGQGGSYHVAVWLLRLAVVALPMALAALWLCCCCCCCSTTRQLPAPPQPTTPCWPRLLPPVAGSHSVALRLVDFGGCFSLTETDTQAVGCEVQTLPYRAPEVSAPGPYRRRCGRCGQRGWCTSGSAFAAVQRFACGHQGASMLGGHRQRDGERMPGWSQTCAGLPSCCPASLATPCVPVCLPAALAAGRHGAALRRRHRPVVCGGGAG